MWTSALPQFPDHTDTNTGRDPDLPRTLCIFLFAEVEISPKKYILYIYVFDESEPAGLILNPPAAEEVLQKSA
jgi:hypothetical protein